MFWGCFSGYGKGPGIFWEKDWGSISSASYRLHILPVINEWVQRNRRNGVDLLFMQDNARGHSAKATVADLGQRGIQCIEWPPYSPDLNPIEYVWDWMKDYIEEHYGHLGDPGYERRRIWVNEAWEAVPDWYLYQLFTSMPKRCLDVIAAHGGHIHA